MADITVSAITSGTDSTSSDTTIVVTHTFTAGNVADLILSFPSARTVSSIASSPVETWTAIGVATDSSNGQKLARYVAKIANGGSTTITVTLDSAASYRFGGVVEVSNCSDYDSAAAAHNEAFQNAPGTGTDAITSGATPTLTSQPALISGWSMNSAGSGDPTPGTGFTDGGSCETVFSGTALIRFEHKRVTATTGQAATFTGAFGSQHITSVAAFLESGGGGGGGAAYNPVAVWFA